MRVAEEGNPMDTKTTKVIVLSERTRFGGETGAGIMRSRCAFTPRDMSADWPDAFTYAIVMGWDDSEGESAITGIAEKFEWDAALIEFVRDAHERFKQLADRHNSIPTTDPK
jgi:hypothetical protein